LNLPDWMKNKPITSSFIYFGPSSTITVTPAAGDTLNISANTVRRYACIMLDVSLDADIDNNHFVNLGDYAKLAARWLNNCDAMNKVR
jgi:hypothetical protein